MTLQARTVCVGASIGVALFRQHANSLEGLYEGADLALYDAKWSGRGVWRLHAQEVAPA